MNPAPTRKRHDRQGGNLSPDLPGRLIIMEDNYHIHFTNRDFILVHSTQEKMICFNRNKIIGMPYDYFMPPSLSEPVIRAIRQAFETGLPVWHSYSLGDHAFLWLIDRIQQDIVAIHEVHDNPTERDRLKRFLWAAAGSFHMSLGKKDAG